MPTPSYVAPPCRAQYLTGDQCDQAVQWASVEASIRSAEAAERANYIGAFGAASSLLALFAAWLAFREARRASNAAEKQAEEAVKSSALALQSVEDARKFGRQQFEMQAASLRSNLLLKSAHLTVNPDTVSVVLQFAADGQQDILDLHADIVPVFETAEHGTPLTGVPSHPTRGGEGLTIKGNSDLTFTAHEEINGPEVHQLLRRGWHQAVMHIRARWRDTMGFVIEEHFIANGPVETNCLSCDLDISFQKKCVEFPALP